MYKYLCTHRNTPFKTVYVLSSFPKSTIFFGSNNKPSPGGSIHDQTLSSKNWRSPTLPFEQTDHVNSLTHRKKVANYLQILEWLVNLPPPTSETRRTLTSSTSEASHFFSNPVLNRSQVVDKDLKELKESWYSPRKKLNGFSREPKNTPPVWLHARENSHLAHKNGGLEV